MRTQSLGKGSSGKETVTAAWGRGEQGFGRQGRCHSCWAILFALVLTLVPRSKRLTDLRYNFFNLLYERKELFHFALLFVKNFYKKDLL